MLSLNLRVTIVYNLDKGQKHEKTKRAAEI